MNNHLTLPGIDVSGYFVRGMGDAAVRFGGMSNKRGYGDLVEWLFLGVEQGVIFGYVRSR
jgi:hypothetical protein